MKIYSAFIFVFILMSCKASDSTSQSSVEFADHWRMVLHVSEDVEIPFELEVNKKEQGYEAVFINGEERLIMPEINVSNESLIIPGHVFASELRLKVSANHLEGEFVKLDTKDPYKVRLTGDPYRNFRTMPVAKDPVADVSGKYEVVFDHNGETSDAIGVFTQDGNVLNGTFMTPFGDYRYLSGEINGEDFSLSTFDGSHLFLFTGKVKGDQLIGDFWSGLTWHETWQANLNPEAQLPDPNTLTYVDSRYHRFDFEFPDVDGKLYHLDSKENEGKVMLIQITGTWCPNCMDETRYLLDLKKRNPSIEIVAVAFEKFEGDKLKKHLETYRGKMGINYPILIGGKASKVDASKAFPLLSDISSFPTLILVDKNKRIRNVHTGFNGPGTGEEYEKFKAEFEEKVKTLLTE